MLPDSLNQGLIETTPSPTHLLPFIDTHAHLSMLKERGIDPHDTLKSLFDRGFGCIIDISLEPGDILKRIEEFKSYPQLRFASGLWPHAASIDNREKLVRELKQDLQAIKSGPLGSRLCALGEFGLDHHWNKDEPECDLNGERELMEMQMETARELELPVIIHSREAADETAQALARFPSMRGVIHCFSYGVEEAKTFLNMGYYISFAGNLTYKNAQNLRDVCAFIPADRLLLETDCPYLSPIPHRGKPAHPGMAEEVYKTSALVRDVHLEDLVNQIAENVKELFFAPSGVCRKTL